LMIDWQMFFDRHGIEYVRSGPNVASGNVNIRCPFCGPNDPSHHMGVSLYGKGWGCWREKEHRGKSHARLIQALLGCTFDEAARMVGSDRHLPDDFQSQVQTYLGGVTPEKKKQIELPAEFKPINSKLPSARPFIHYLVDRRGHTLSEVDEMYERFDIRYCTRGPYKGRVVFPIYFEGKLVTWTGRTIYKNTDRYKTLSVDVPKAEREGLDPALESTTNLLLWWDMLPRRTANTICIVEGPFDALKVMLLGRSIGVDATCLFTMHASDDQLSLLHELLASYARQCLLLDRGALASGLRLKSQLCASDIELKQLPSSLKDPGELVNVSQLKKILAK